MIQSSSLSFLSNLKNNNNKPWFEKNRDKYLSAKTDFENFVKDIIERTSSFDQDIKLLEVKNCTFRINRDIRFSKNKTPYKSNMGASFNRGGKKSIYAGYYFHQEPGGKSFAGGGLWMPAAPELKKLRQEIDYCYPEFKKILNSSSFKTQYGGLEMNRSDMLVNVPKGYAKDNAAVEFLKLKSFVATKNIADSSLTSPSLGAEVAKAFKALMPLVKFMNGALE
ncbi:MAG: DUF2461 domain-containing protein [Bacteroidota bacterium]|nr:DUF2461 domain-containing protein [Bacteroidota bacterium]